MKTKYYTFRQNNSGGSFDIEHDRGISIAVIIEAETADQANNRAESIGLYFDGCSQDLDCECCGDRWYLAEEYDGHDEPEIYREKLIEISEHEMKNPTTKKWWRNDRAYVHMLDGTIKTMGQSDIMDDYS